MSYKHICTACGNVDEINPAAMLGSIKSEAKLKACRENAKKPRPGARGKRKPRKENPDDPHM